MRPTPPTSCASRRSHHPELLRERSRARDPRGLRQGRAHDHHQRQRHRHVARRGHRQHRHHRQVGHAEFLATLTGDDAKDARLIGQFGVGFYSSFIVADRVTLVTRRAGCPAAEGVRWESAGEGDYTIEPSSAPQRGTEVTLHLREGQDDCLTRWKLASIIRKYSDHIALPIVMRKEEWDEEKKAHRDDRRRRDRQPGLGAVGAAEAGHHGRAVRRVLQARRARQRGAARLRPRQGRGPHRVHAAALHSLARAVRPLGPRPPARAEALRPARVHHGRCRAAAAGVPALRPRRRRLQRPAAQRLARDPAGVARRRGDPERLRQARARRCSRTSPRTRRRSTRRSGRRSAGC